MNLPTLSASQALTVQDLPLEPPGDAHLLCQQLGAVPVVLRLVLHLLPRPAQHWLFRRTAAFCRRRRRFDMRRGGGVIYGCGRAGLFRWRRFLCLRALETRVQSGGGGEGKEGALVMKRGY